MRAGLNLASFVLGMTGIFGVTAQAANFVFNYQPSQPTGYGLSTFGGHTPSVNFTDGTDDGLTYQISELPFGQMGASPNPVYEGSPSNGTIMWQKVLNAAFSGSYLFNIPNNFVGTNEFNIQSYSVLANDGGQIAEDLYVVYNQGNDGMGNNDPAPTNKLHWIQVISDNWASGDGNTTGVKENLVDNGGAAVPYYDKSGGGKGTAGLTTIAGNQVFNFYDQPARPSEELAAYNFNNGPIQWMAEDFLVADTGTMTGKQENMNVYGGLEYGWQVTLVPEPMSAGIIVLAALGILNRRRRFSR